MSITEGLRGCCLANWVPQGVDPRTDPLYKDSLLGSSWSHSGVLSGGQDTFSERWSYLERRLSSLSGGRSYGGPDEMQHFAPFVASSYLAVHHPEPVATEQYTGVSRSLHS